MEDINKKDDHHETRGDAGDDASLDIDNAIDDLLGGLDEDIIELTEKAEEPQKPDDDDMIIDLVDRVAPESPVDEAPDEDDGIIELTEVVEMEPAPAASDDSVDDDIIELVDMAAPETQTEDNIAETEDIEEVIELTDVGDATADFDLPLEVEDVALAFQPVDGEPDETEDAVIELTDPVEPAVDDTPKETIDEPMVEPADELEDAAPLFAEPAETPEMETVEEPEADDPNAFEETLLSLPDDFDAGDTAALEAMAVEFDSTQRGEMTLSDFFPEASDQDTPREDVQEDVHDTSIEADEATDGPDVSEAPAPEPVADDLPEIMPAEPEPQQIIQLADVLNHSQARADETGDDIRLGAEDALATEDMEDDLDSTAESMGIEIPDLEAEGLPDVTASEIENALERIIMRKFGTTIEELITKTVERKVTSEIEQLKRAMMEDDE